MKRMFLFLIILMLFAVNGFSAAALDEELYQEQLEESGAEELSEAVSEEAAEYINNLGVQPGNAEIKISDVFGEITDIFSASLNESFISFTVVAAFMIIAALILCIAENSQSAMLKQMISVCSVTAVCTVLSVPAAQYISAAANAIEHCCVFNELFVPVYAGIAAASGHTVSAAGYSTASFIIIEATSIAMDKILLPLLKAVLALSFVSVLSPSLKLNSTIKMIEKYLKWILGFLAVIIVGVMGISSTSSAALDGLTSKTAKYVISSAVPVLGSAMGEALAAVKGCVGVLRTSVGSFGMVAMAFTLLPALIRGIVLQVYISICAIIADMFGLKNLKDLSDSVISVLSVMVAMIVFIAILTIFTLAITLGKGI